MQRDSVPDLPITITRSIVTQNSARVRPILLYRVNRKPAPDFSHLYSVHTTTTHLSETHLITFLPKELRPLS
jgi:hypothetical protein